MLNLIAVAIFATMAAAVFAGVRAQVKLGVYQMRQTQAQEIAEAGLEDAMHSLQLNNAWRTGFNQKSFANGYYTVTVSSTASGAIAMESTGYSQSIFTFGSAVKTVSANAVFVTSETATKGVLANSLTVSGTINAYDPNVTLTPSTGDWVNNVIIFSNAGIDTSGASCPPANVQANAYYYSGPAPGSSCVSGNIVNSTYTIPLSVTACGTCQTINNNATGILPSSAYVGGQGKLSIGTGQTVRLSSGTYFFHQIQFQGNGTLVADTSSGTVNVFYDNKIQETSTCYFINTSKKPSRLLLADINNSNKVDLSCLGELHAYLEGQTNNFEIHPGGVLYGHIIAQGVTIDAGAYLHYDLGEGITYDHVQWSLGSSGSWSESYARQ